MSDLRELLDLAAGDSPPPAPLAAIRSRGQSIGRRRRIAVGAVLAVAVAVLTFVAPWLPSSRPEPAKPPSTPQLKVGTPAPGTYTTRLLGQDLTLTVPAAQSWRVSLLTATSMVLANDPLQAEIDVVHWNAVHPPTSTGGAQATTQPPPADLMTWLAHHPGIHAMGPPQPTTLAGLPAHLLRVTLRSDRKPTEDQALGCPVATDCLIVAETADNPIVLLSDATVTITAQDRPSPTRVVVVTQIANSSPQPANDPIATLVASIQH